MKKENFFLLLIPSQQRHTTTTTGQDSSQANPRGGLYILASRTMEVCVRISLPLRRNEAQCIQPCIQPLPPTQHQTHQDSRTHNLHHTHSRARQQGGRGALLSVKSQSQSQRRAAARRTIQKSNSRNPRSLQFTTHHLVRRRGAVPARVALSLSLLCAISGPCPCHILLMSMHSTPQAPLLMSRSPCAPFFCLPLPHSQTRLQGLDVVPPSPALLSTVLCHHHRRALSSSFPTFFSCSSQPCLSPPHSPSPSLFHYPLTLKQQ